MRGMWERNRFPRFDPVLSAECPVLPKVRRVFFLAGGPHLPAVANCKSTGLVIAPNFVLDGP